MADTPETTNNDPDDPAPEFDFEYYEPILPPDLDIDLSDKPGSPPPEGPPPQPDPPGGNPSRTGGGTDGDGPDEEDESPDDGDRAGETDGGSESERGGEDSHGRKEALSSTATGVDGRKDPFSSPADPDSGGQTPVWNPHDGGDHDGGDSEAGTAPPKRAERSGEGRARKPGPRGFLQEKVRGTNAELRVIEESMDAAYSGRFSDEKLYRPVARRLLAHIYYCLVQFWGASRYEEGVPISHRLLIEVCKEYGLPIPSSTEAVWKPLEDAGLITVTEYVHRPGEIGRSRRFRLGEPLRTRLTAAHEESAEQTTRYNLSIGRRSWGGDRTELSYDGSHSWKERSPFLYRTLKALRGQRDLVNKEAVQNHLKHLKRVRDCKKRLYEDAKRRRASGETLVGLHRDYGRQRARYDQDLRIWTDIVAQGLTPARDQPAGIYQYETAYKVQEASGRLTMTGLQNASKAMKAAAATGIPGYRNYDIASSQTEALIQEMQDANRRRANLNVEVLTEYAGKDELARRYGIDRDHWKRPEHAVKFGAGFRHSTYVAALKAARARVRRRISGGDEASQVLHQLPHESRKMAYERAVYKEIPTMAQVARDWADDTDIEEDDPEVIYGMLREIYGPMAEEIDRWREWLVDGHWRWYHSRGGPHGAFVKNPCGLAFSIHDDRFTKEGTIDRYGQKVAYATSRLQGLEAAYMHALAQIAGDYDYEFLRNEHDGAVVIGMIPEDARRRAREMSGFHRARLEEKPFGGANDDTASAEVLADERVPVSAVSASHTDRSSRRPETERASRPVITGEV